ncbi:MAG TPA: heme exporter protein CcmD [Rhizobiales bacterium]|nr:heme exporter protein CcmD [Hyphomicrobiales bacterium]
MDLSAKHTGFVLASYAISALVLGILIAATIMRERRTRVKLSRLEKTGARRRKRSRTAND